MKKFYLKNGKEVQLGDTICKVEKIKHPLFGEGDVVEHVLVTKEIIPTLIKNGIIEEKNVKRRTKKPSTDSNSEVPMDLEYYVQKIADKMGWHIEKVYNYLNSIDTLFPAAALGIILREIAIELDKKYEDHIKNSPEIYAISLTDGRITNICKATIKNYRNFAAFRSIKDAKIACSIVRDILKELFKSGK